jgi:hypothetical protein
MSTINLKYKFEELYSRALDCETVLKEVHPVRVVQSIKSIVGINPKEPLHNLIEFCSIYIDSFKISSLDWKFKENNQPEVITFADLEIALKSKDLSKSLDNAYNLSKVSDGRHIIEFLVEFSIKYKLDSFFDIWSVYKMMLFLKGKNIEKNILFCIYLIVNDSVCSDLTRSTVVDIDFDKYQYDKNNLKLYLIYYSILNEDLVRIDNISKHVKNNLLHFCLFENCNIRKNANIKQRHLGRLWINEYFKNIKSKDLSADLIINFESFRAALKSSNGVNDNMLWANLNRYLENNDSR